MHLVDDRGRVVDAEYLIEADRDRLALIMESRSGMSGSRAPRNPDYNRALAILLGRLGKLNAVLVDALVDSRHTQATGSHAGSHRGERPSGIPDGHEQRTGTRPRSRTDLNGSGRPYG